MSLATSRLRQAAPAGAAAALCALAFAVLPGPVAASDVFGHVPFDQRASSLPGLLPGDIQPITYRQSQGQRQPGALELPPAPADASGQPSDSSTRDEPMRDAQPSDEADKSAENAGDEENEEPATEEPEEEKWYDKYSIRGYAQFRFNRLGETNDDLRHWNDRSVGDDRSFFLRRARIILSGDVTDWLSIYIQPDFASDAASDRQHFVQVRDYYADIFLDECKEFRIRVGQSKVPYGFEVLQSSSNRLTLDRADAINSGAPNERDLGIFFYWAPTHIRQRFKFLVDEGLKGTGDYGVVGLGIYNGQSANRPEENDDRHLVFRVTYPFCLPGGQIFEPGFSAYRGVFHVDTDGGIVGGNVIDQRAAWSFVFYPQPLGLQGEFTVGQGPELNETRTVVERESLHGGYLQLFYRVECGCYGVAFPYVKAQYYRGGLKHATNAPRQEVDEVDLGVEWQPDDALELTVAYALMDRTSTEFPYLNERGGLLRMQLQWNY